jgi:hypothetical protein
MMAVQFRAMAHTAKTSPFDSEEIRNEKARCYTNCAIRLEYAADLPKHEGASHVRMELHYARRYLKKEGVEK